MTARTSALFFLDVHGWTQARDDEWQLYVSNLLPDIGFILSNHSPTSLNTWGDAIFAIFDSCTSAAHAALEIRDYFYRRGSSFLGVLSPLTPRIALHAGEVHTYSNPLTNRPDFFGNSIHVAARLEPIVPPGSVWCTERFMTLCRDTPSLCPTFIDQGHHELAKNFGRYAIFSIHWPAELSPGTFSQEPNTISPTGLRASDPLKIINRAERLQLAAHRYKSYRDMGVNVPEPDAAWSDSDLSTFGMVRIYGTTVLADVFPVSELDYWTYCSSTHFPPPSYLRDIQPRHDYPVVRVSAFEADLFAAWAQKRLPTLQEWNMMAYAQPNGNVSDYPWGSQFNPALCNSHETGLGELWPFTTCSDARSPAGAYDCVGNCWEWTSSSYNQERIVVGGSWYDAGKYCKRGATITWDPNAKVQDIGFRLFSDT